jgi:hypothetical protein
MANFPRVRIGDDVRAQQKLVTEQFGLKSLALVVGGSMGAQQQVLAAGAVCVLSKPFEGKTLVRCIESALSLGK